MTMSHDVERRELFAEFGYLSSLLTEMALPERCEDRERLQRWLGEDILLVLEIEDPTVRCAWMIAWARAWSVGPERLVRSTTRRSRA